MELNEAQQKKLKELRKRVDGILTEYFRPDYELARFLIGRNFDVDKAEAMVRKTMDWRKAWQIDRLLQWEPPEVLTKYYPFGLIGFDKEGSPVWLSPEGGQNMRGILQSCSPRDYVLYTLRVVEQSLKLLKEQTEKLGKKITRHSLIYDFEQLSLSVITWKPAKDVVLELAEIYTLHYPEFLKIGYVINAPRVFTVAYALVKPFMDESTINKIQIFGKTGWKEALLKDIDADVLPEYLGGKCQDPDGNPKCLSKINFGGDVPKEYYLKSKSPSSSSFDKLKTIEIPNGGKKTFEFVVKEGGSQLRWEFQSQDYDIAFGVTRTLPSGIEEILITQHRVSSHITPEEGTLICTEQGTYKVTFCNEFSYMRPKTVYYRIQLDPPDPDLTTQF